MITITPYGNVGLVLWCLSDFFVILLSLVGVECSLSSPDSTLFSLVLVVARGSPLWRTRGADRHSPTT